MIDGTVETYRSKVIELVGRPSSREYIIAELEKNGVCGSDADELLKTIGESLHNEPSFRNARAKRLRWQLDVYSKLAAIDNQGFVERVHRPSLRDFREMFYKQNRPVVLTGLVDDWSEKSRWTFHNLRSAYGRCAVEAMFDRDKDLFDGQVGSESPRNLSFEEYLDLVESTNESNTFYMIARNKNHKSSLEDLAKTLPAFSPYLDGTQHGAANIWIGPRGTVTRLHHDEVNVFFQQIEGRKRFRLISPLDSASLYSNNRVFSLVNPDAPDLSLFPMFADATSYDLVLNPGEVLFIPVGWWHHVRALDPSISAAHLNFVFPNSFSFEYGL